MRTVLLGLLIASAVLVPTVALADKGGQPHQGSNGIGNDPDKHDDQNERRCNDHNQDKNPHCNSGGGSGNGGGTNSTGNNSGSGSGSGSNPGTNSTQAGGDSTGSNGGSNNQGNGNQTNQGNNNQTNTGSNSGGISNNSTNDGGSGTSGNQNNGSGNNNNQGSNQQGGTSDQEKLGFSAGSGRVSNWPFQHMIEKRVLCQTYKDEKDCYAYQLAYYGYFGAKAEPQDMHTQWDSYYQRMVAWIS